MKPVCPSIHNKRERVHCPQTTRSSGTRTRERCNICTVSPATGPPAALTTVKGTQMATPLRPDVRFRGVPDIRARAPAWPRHGPPSSLDSEGPPQTSLCSEPLLSPLSWHPEGTRETRGSGGLPGPALCARLPPEPPFPGCRC